MLALAGCTGGGGNEGDGGGSLEDMEPITLTWAEPTAETAPVPGAIAGARVFMNYVTEATGGKVTFEEYWAAALFPGTETLANVGAGVADVGLTFHSYTPSDLPIGNWFLNAATLADPSYAFGALQGNGAAWELNLRNQDMIDEMTEHNVKVINASGASRYNQLCRQEAASLEQMRGLRMRMGGGVWVAEVEHLGAQPQFIPLVEIYEAMQRGVIDCVILGPGSFRALSLLEVAKHFSAVPYAPLSGAVRIVNLDTWNSFPEELKRIFFEASAHEQANVASVGMDIANPMFAPENEFDLVFDDATEVTESLLAFQEERVANLPESAPSELEDPEAFLDEYKEYLEKWYDILDEVSPFEAGADQDARAYAEQGNTDWSWQDAYLQYFLDQIPELMELDAANS